MASIGILLIALALGYVVCFLANREEKDLRKLGFAVGFVVIVLSGAILLNKLFGLAKEYTQQKRSCIFGLKFKPPQR